ncbi:MAG: F0F1 ATP synthase subunit A [Candidatus Accumulibacter sp.]|jgi:F-type H+-transporting ATPase subunit a|nr:F0F1 ATP synthase subunit A [Accumulibacter sp.]
MAAGHEATAMTSGEYIIHHLTPFNNIGKAQESIADFSVINYDTIFFSLTIGLIGVYFMWRATRNSTAGVPGRAQAAIELIADIVHTQAAMIIPDKKALRTVVPLAMTVLVWIFLMNALDFLPLDLFPLIWQKLSGNPHAFLRGVPTADLNGTLGAAGGVLVLVFIFNCKTKGFWGWMHEMCSVPLGDNPLLYLPNFAMHLSEFASKTLSHGMRLYGNMYAGELLFIMIALMGGAFTWSLGGYIAFVCHVIAGSAWAIFHILIIGLQAFIFMMMALVYIGQAHSHH